MTQSIRRAVAMLVGGLNLFVTACAGMQPFESVPSALKANPSVIEVVTRDGGRMTLTQPSVKGDSVGGFVVENKARHYRHIALADVDTVKAKNVNGNGGAVAIGAVMAGVVAVLVFASHYCTLNCNSR